MNEKTKHQLLRNTTKHPTPKHTNKTKRAVTKTGIASRALRNISRRKMRALLVIVVLSVSMSIMIAIPAGISANQEAAQGLTGNLGKTIQQTQETINRTLTQIDCTLMRSSLIAVTPVGGEQATTQISISDSSLGGGDSMSQSYYSNINNITGVAAIAPILQVTEGHNVTITPQLGGEQSDDSVRYFNITVPDYIINGIPLNESLITNHPILPSNITAGRNLLPGETGSVILSENCSAYFNKTVGDTVNILGKNFTVVGIFGPSGATDQQYLYMDLAEAQAITNNTDTMTLLRVFTTNPDMVNSVASTISEKYPELNVETAHQRLSQLKSMQSLYDSQLQSAQTVMAQTQSQAYIEIIIAISATSAIVLFVMLYTVRDRTKEVGTLKAIGASNRTVMGQFLLEGVLLSFMAGIGGVIIGVVAAPYLTSALLPTVGGMLSSASGGGSLSMVDSIAASASATNMGESIAVTVSPTIILMALGVSVLLGALGSLYPAWRAARTRPAEAMRYE